MNSSFPLFPDSASTHAGHVDALFIIWALISIFFTILIAGLIVYFMARYRRRHPEEVGTNDEMAVWLEIAWSAIPLAIALAMFVWGTRVFFDLYRPPANAVDVPTSHALYAAFARLEDDPGLRAGIVTGAGSRFAIALTRPGSPSIARTAAKVSTKPRAISSSWF